MTVKNEQKDDLGNLVRQTRKLAGLTQMELATRAGVGKDLVFKIEKGSTQITFENIQKVLKVLNIKLQFKLPFSNTKDEE